MTQRLSEDEARALMWWIFSPIMIMVSIIIVYIIGMLMFPSSTDSTLASDMERDHRTLSAAERKEHARNEARKRAAEHAEAKRQHEKLLRKHKAKTKVIRRNRRASMVQSLNEGLDKSHKLGKLKFQMRNKVQKAGAT